MVAVIQLCVLAVLAVNDALTGITGFVALGFACMIASCIWTVLRRSESRIRMNSIAADTKQSWQLGKWILASHVTMMLGIQTVQWLLVIFLDESATGLFVAPLMMVMIVNPFLMGLTNVFLPASASALASGRRHEVRSNVRVLTLLLMPLMSMFGVAVIVFGSDFLLLIYGKEFSGQGFTIILLGITVIIRTFGIPANIGLWVFQHTKENFFCAATGYAVTVIVTIFAIPHAHIAGAAIGLLVGDTVSTSLRWWRWESWKLIDNAAKAG